MGQAEEDKGKNWDNYNRVTIKQKKKEKTLFLHSYHQNFVSFKDANWGNHNSKVNIFKKSFKVVIVAVPQIREEGKSISQKFSNLTEFHLFLVGVFIFLF